MLRVGAALLRPHPCGKTKFGDYTFYYCTVPKIYLWYRIVRFNVLEEGYGVFTEQSHGMASLCRRRMSIFQDAIQNWYILMAEIDQQVFVYL